MHLSIQKHMDIGSLIIALLTAVLFAVALFVKGLTHDLFLESGVLLVSVKIIIMGYKNSLAVSRLEEKLDVIAARLSTTASHEVEHTSQST